MIIQKCIGCSERMQPYDDIAYVCMNDGCMRHGLISVVYNSQEIKGEETLSEKEIDHLPATWELGGGNVPSTRDEDDVA